MLPPRYHRTRGTRNILVSMFEPYLKLDSKYVREFGRTT